MQSFTVHTTQRCQLIDVSAEVRRCLREAGVSDGLGVVYCPHTTAAITINESYDPDVAHDMLLWLEQHVPKQVPGFRHGEGNSDSHIKSSLVGSSATVLVENGDIVLGRWQGVFFCEFDGPRQRMVLVKWIKAA